MVCDDRVRQVCDVIMCVCVSVCVTHAPVVSFVVVVRNLYMTYIHPWEEEPGYILRVRFHARRLESDVYICGSSKR